MSAIVTVDRVVKRWDASSGLEPVSFELSPGQVTVVQGRSGSGKSTLLAILAGWCEPDDGSIVRHGEWQAAWSDWTHTAIVPQVLANVAELSVGENLATPLRLDRHAARTKAEIAERVEATLDALDLLELCDRRPAEISVGQQQRLAVGRAVVISPTLLLADEPTSHQDSGHAATVVAALVAAADRGAAVLIASHEPAVVAAASSVITLDA